MQVDLSIIIPVYNTEDYISECLTSCLEQIGSSIIFEIIVIDDGSNDDSLKVIYTFSEKFEHLKVIEQTNQKQGAARNRGLEMATGEYVWFIDSDDWVSTKSFISLKNVIEENKIDVLRFGAVECHETKDIPRVNRHLKNNTYTSFEVMEENKFSSCTPFYLFKRSFLEKNNIRFIEGIFFEDNEFIFQVFASQPRFISITEILYYIRIRENSTTRSKNYFRYLDIVTVVESMVLQTMSVKFNEKSKAAAIDLIGRNVNSVLFGTLPSARAFNEGVMLLSRIENLGKLILQGNSELHKIQFKLLKHPSILRIIMRVFYKFKSILNV
jgi:glycosyltransferase involved in cell wall biosynthesis